MTDSLGPEERLLAAIRASPHLLVTRLEALRASGVPKDEFAGRLLNPGRFEVVAVNTSAGHRNLIRASLSRDNLLELAPQTLERLQRAYADQAQDLQRGVAQLLESGHVSIHEGVLTAGAAPVNDADLRVLNLLEDLEADRINFGIYETFTSKDTLLAESAARLGDERFGEVQLADSLSRLVKNWLALQLDEDHYRSRISEIARVVKHVKQRFPGRAPEDSPYLVQSLQVHFEQRRRINRQHAWVNAVERLGRRHASMRSEGLRDALQAVSMGFAEAIGARAEDALLTGVQDRAFGQIGDAYLGRKGGGFVVTGNTGSGKTEAVILPLLLGALQERLSGIDGCKVILIYPRQALAKNQLERIARYVAHVNKQPGVADREGLSVGIAFGETPLDEDELTVHARRGSGNRRGSWVRAADGFVLPYFEASSGKEVVCSKGEAGNWVLASQGFDWTFRHFRPTRKAIRESPPDILIITTEMLHRWLRQPEYSDVFGGAAGSGSRFSAARAVVVDEIHLYDTIHGAQVGMLLRRLRQRLEAGLRREGRWRSPMFLGMSATIGSPADFWKELSGVSVEAIEPRSEDMKESLAREYYMFIQPETFSRGKHVGDASTAIQVIMAIAHNMMRRRGGPRDGPKFRTLVFQDSIGKVKKLALEFTDAESRKQLAMLRTDAGSVSQPAVQSSQFHDGEYWIFEVEDLLQYSSRRQLGDAPAPLTSTEQPVYSGTGSNVTELLDRDVIFATTSLEVGYDDPAIQFVLQHHAPRNAASFVQKKGRGGRALDDRPITAVTLSGQSFRDAFYYYNPQLLYAPPDYVPPLNIDNHFVQRIHVIALVFDLLAFNAGQSIGEQASVERHLDHIDERLREGGSLARQMDRAYPNVTTEGFREAEGHWREVWGRFKDEVRDSVFRDQDRVHYQKLLSLWPGFPANLFSSINMPTVRVGYPPRLQASEFERQDEDVAMAFIEFAPGRVTRRYGRSGREGQVLHWRPLYAQLASGQRLQDAVAVERYKADRVGQRPGPFRPADLQVVADIWGDEWRSELPEDVMSLYGEHVPESFYRARFIELWSFGQISARNPHRAATDWRARVRQDGSVETLRLERGIAGASADGSGSNTLREIDPNSNAYPLSFSIVRTRAEEEAPVLPLPPIFPKLLDRLHFFFGLGGRRNASLAVWEVYYGTDALIRLRPNGPNDRAPRLAFNRVRYVNEFDGSPTFYGYDMTTEGLSAQYDGEVLDDLVDSVLDAWLNDPARQTTVQDQFLRFLLKTRHWPLTDVDMPLNKYDQGLAGDLIATVRAEVRTAGVALDGFIESLGTEDGIDDFARIAMRFGYGQRALTPDFLERFRSTLRSPRVRAFLRDDILTKVRSKAHVKRYLVDVLVHSLEHATRNLFILEGSTRDEEVGSHAGLSLMRANPPTGSAFYVYERNHGGNGSTRSAYDRLAPGRGNGIGRAWWDVTMTCPVGDEERFLRSALRRAGDALQDVSDGYFSAGAGDRGAMDLGEVTIATLEAGIGANSFFRRNLKKIQRLAQLLTAEITIADAYIRRLPLQRELLALDALLESRFRRRPTSTELAGFALSTVSEDPESYPELSRLQGAYKKHAARIGAQLDGTEDDTGATWEERFIAQIEHIALATCIDGCPACIASSCDQGRIDVMKHTLSRDLLRECHVTLTGEATVGGPPFPSVDHLKRQSATRGFLILSSPEDLPADLLRRMKDAGLETHSVVFDYETLEIRTILTVTVT